jgi:hypothetical protein
LLWPRPAAADTLGWNGQVTFGPSTTNDLTATQISDYCVEFLFTCTPGLGLSGFDTGTDSLGGTYTLGSSGTLFSYSNGAPNPWYSSPSCAGYTYSICQWNNGFSFTDTSASGGTGFGGEATLSQASSGDASLDLTVCTSVVTVPPGIQECGQTGNLIFELQIDPTMLAQLPLGQSVGLSVVGGA